MRRHTPSLVLTLSLSLPACAPVDDADVAQRAEAVTAPAPYAPLPAQQGPRGGVKVWSYGSDPALRANGATPAGWSGIAFGDVNGDGLDDLCGWVSGRYGCSLRGATERFEGFLPVPAFDGIVPNDVFNVNLHWVADLDADRRADVCVRDARGVLCAYSTGAGFVVPALPNGAPQPFVADFSDANGWNADAYGSTIGVLRRGGPFGIFGAALCGRGRDGVRCWVYNGARSRPAWPSRVATTFSDAQFWNQPKYYRTVRYADVTGDEVDEVCGRGSDGIYCAFFDPIALSFGPATLWGPDFSDQALGRAVADFAVQDLAFVDLDGDRRSDVCHVSMDGTRCARSVYEGFGVNRFRDLTVGPQFSSATTPGSPWFSRWLCVADLDGDGRGDLCSQRASSINALYCARARGGAALDPVVRRTTEPGFPVTLAQTAHLRRGAAQQLCSECAGLGAGYVLGDVCCTD